MPRNSKLVFDLACPIIDETRFNQDCNLKPFYGGMQEAVSVNAPEARGKPIVLHLYVDVDHTGQQDYLPFLNRLNYLHEWWLALSIGI
jgi:hypothetical protein